MGAPNISLNCAGASPRAGSFGVGRGIAAGVAGTVAMTAFQKLVEMPLTRRDASFVPAEMASKLLGVRPKGNTGWTQLNYAAHFGVGLTWGLARAAVARAGLRGQAANATVYTVLWNADWAALVALGIDTVPWRWRRRDLAIDMGEKLILAQVIGFTFDRLEDRDATR